MIEDKNFRLAMEVFKTLLTGEEISAITGKNAVLYTAYTQNVKVNDMVDEMIAAMNLKLYDYKNSLFLSAGDSNRLFGYTNEELKRIMGLRLNRELYLCYYIIFSIMTCFYQNCATYLYTDYIKVTTVLKVVEEGLQGIIKNINFLAKSEMEECSFETLAMTWDELLVVSNEDIQGVRASRGSKTGYIKLVLNFLISQRLFVESAQRYYPTERFHAMMIHYFEKEQGRLAEIRKELEKKEESESATH